MGSVVVLIVIVVASLICVRAGAIALELTGMKSERAKFQALSAFTNTGFTTCETEEITNFPIRRKIFTVLIVFGHTGTVSVIAAFATSLLQSNSLNMAMNGQDHSCFSLRCLSPCIVARSDYTHGTAHSPLAGKAL